MNQKKVKTAGITLLELKPLAEEYSRRTLDDFLENIALVSDQDTLTEGNVPTLLTRHAAKGLEFGVVFLVGVDDGILPHSRSFYEPEQMEEERRLFYVGITRAKDKLYLIRSIQRGGRGSQEETYPSRFLDDVPADLLVGKTRTGRDASSPFRTVRGTSSETKWQTYNASRQPTTAPVTEAKVRAGTRIKHPTWGEGIVLDSKIQDSDEIVDVVFESVGIKRLSSSLANLKIISSFGSTNYCATSNSRCGLDGIPNPNFLQVREQRTTATVNGQPSFGKILVANNPVSQVFQMQFGARLQF